MKSGSKRLKYKLDIKTGDAVTMEDYQEVMDTLGIDGRRLRSDPEGEIKKIVDIDVMRDGQKLLDIILERPGQLKVSKLSPERAHFVVTEAVNFFLLKLLERLALQKIESTKSTGLPVSHLGKEEAALALNYYLRRSSPVTT